MILPIISTFMDWLLECTLLAPTRTTAPGLGIFGPSGMPGFIQFMLIKEYKVLISFVPLVTHLHMVGTWTRERLS